ncbi:MAG: sigma-70 family RNA polymerase sigma factor [Chitinophagaceae bacterium]|nr:sigma-70 family RNA polymerase sigma factor [Chitinophagaceae bacterium]
MLTNACHTVAWTRLKNGKQEALLDLYNHHYIGLLNYGIKLTGNRELTTDCITQVLLRLWDNRERLPVVENVRSYLLTCLRREIMSEIKLNSSRHQKTALYINEIHDKEFSYEEYLIQIQHNKELSERLRRAMETLTQREKELLRMKFFEDLEYDEIATRCSITKRTAYNIVHHALKTLKASLLQPCPANSEPVPYPVILTSLCCLLFL